ncbi:BMP family ABC transporter substrate-binding protein [Acidisoma silvae]|uniref:BMP family ABC transporter substrate-binding protein n=1 Tax=Acidisoma silvae TaxID=2802396 RepID=A0A964DZH5_9PROT|nr:BMP family ABC transporter substrate-binding protein [Acidisoma silvae]MCB8876104.1 BMP family ABC transporter substrate-binding protein [Acidisoma silvae]
MKRLSLLASAFGLVGAVGFATHAQAQVKLSGPPKIAFIYLGAISDGGWTGAQNRARLVLQKEFGVKIPYVENIPEQTEKVEQTIDLFVNRGYNVIIGGTYGYGDAFKAEAKAHPNVAFVNMAGVTTAPNLESPYPKTYQGWYLAGYAAGSVTKSKVIGMIEGFPIPTVLWDINAYAKGAADANPGTVAKVAFVNSWSDPVKEGQLANAMLEQGADVIATDMDSPAAIVQSEKAGKFSVGYENDMSAAAPKTIMTSIVFHWDKMLVPMIKALKAGTWTSAGASLYGMDDGMVAITEPVNHVTPAVQSKIDAMKAEMVAGKFEPFSGPIKAQDGSTKVEAGKVMTVDQLFGMNYLFSNVQGSIK